MLAGELGEGVANGSGGANGGDELAGMSTVTLSRRTKVIWPDTSTFQRAESCVPLRLARELADVIMALLSLWPRRSLESNVT